MTHAAPISRHHPHLKYLDHKELGALYWSVFIKGLGDSLISIFTAIYLLKSGFALHDVALFYIIFNLTLAFLFRPSTTLSHIWGVKKSLALGTFILIIYYLLLTLIPHGLPFWIAAGAYGIGGSLYWSAFQLDLAGALRTRSSGRSLSNVKIFTIAAGIIGPVLGAVFIVNWSFTALFGIVAIILAFSVTPLFRQGDFRIHEKMPTVPLTLSVGGLRKAWMYGLFGFTESAIDILWPVFLYLHYQNLLSVGSIISATSFLMLFVIFLVGKLADKNSLQAYRLGVLTHAPTWILRLLWLTPGGLLAGNFLGTATSSLIAITVDQTMYHDAKTAPNTAAVLLFRTYYAAIGRIALLAIAVITNSSAVLFLIVAAVTLFQLWGAPSRPDPHQKTT